MSTKYTVIGDCFVDRYWIGTSDRISPEAPVPVVKIQETKDFFGGAANVAKNIMDMATKGSTVYLIRDYQYIAVGSWTIPDILKEDLPIKNRLMVGDHQVARWDENDVCGDAIRYLQDRVEGFDQCPIVIADYGKGSISQGVIKWLSEASYSRHIYIDTKASPLKFWQLKPQNVTMFPNSGEFKKYENEYLKIAEDGVTVVLKMGKEGIGVIENGRAVAKFAATCATPYSVIGAGDTVIAAYCVAKEEGLGDPLLLANKAAGIKVGKKYTASVERNEWLR